MPELPRIDLNHVNQSSRADTPSEATGRYTGVEERWGATFHGSTVNILRIPI